MEIIDRGYGKNNVRLLYVRREGAVHHVKDIEVNTRLTLATEKDFTHGNNEDIIATDSQKNTVYILAKKRGIDSIEEFALDLCNHFLATYPHVLKTQIYIEQLQWRRVIDDKGRQHNHAFVSNPEYIRTCKVIHERHGVPQITAGIKGLKVMKTTQSAFVKFIRDEYTVLPESDDRILCTVVASQWKYNTHSGFNFCRTWNRVREEIVDTFAGPADTGVFSPSVQQTLYNTEARVLSKIPQIDSMNIELPNVHHYEADFSKFHKLGIHKNNEVFIPADKPSGNIQAEMARKPYSKL